MSKFVQSIAAHHKHSKENPDGWLHRVIPFAGGLGEFWNWDCEGVSEVVNDVDGRLMAFYRTLQDEELFKRFFSLVDVAPFSQKLWEEAHAYFTSRKPPNPPLDDAQIAYYLFVLLRQSMSGRGDSFQPMSRTRLRRGMNEQVSSWMSAVDDLPEAHERMRRVVLMCDDWEKVCKREDGGNTLFLMDPPYEPSSRQPSARNIYAHEFTSAAHKKLLDWAKQAKGYIMICGYHCETYDKALADWTVHEHEQANHSGGGSTKGRRTEVIWSNF